MLGPVLMLRGARPSPGSGSGLWSARVTSAPTHQVSDGGSTHFLGRSCPAMTIWSSTWSTATPRGLVTPQSASLGSGCLCRARPRAPLRSSCLVFLERGGRPSRVCSHPHQAFLEPAGCRVRESFRRAQERRPPCGTVTGRAAPCDTGVLQQEQPRRRRPGSLPLRHTVISQTIPAGLALDTPATAHSAAL